ncbi:MATE family efflux transporter [Patescibacteria group bacterium]|nr:MATE family efflux transporter [Patescibacteria group bacterium]
MKEIHNNAQPKSSILLKNLLKLAAPITLAQLFQIAYQFTDAFWVGRLGEKAVAAVAMSMPILFFMISMGVGLAIAGSTLTAQYFGAKNEKMLSQAAAQTMLMVIAVSLFFSFIGYIFTPSILRLLGTDISIFVDAKSYLRIAFLGLVFNFSFFIFQSIMRSIGRAQIPVYIVIGTVVLNFVLDPLFMFGFWFIPAQGITGVALATIGTQSIAAIIGLSWLFSGKYGIHLHWHDFRPNFKFIKKAFLLGLPSSLEQSARSLSLTVITGLIATFGTLAVAAYGVGTNILQLMLMTAFGLAGANAALVGKYLGAGESETARHMAKISLKIAFFTFSGLALISYIFAPYLIQFFVPNDPNVIAAGTRYLHFISPIFGLIGLQIIVGSTLQAAGSTKTAMILTMISTWLIQIPFIYTLSHFTTLGLDGLWLAFPLSSLVSVVMYLIVFKYSHWHEKELISAEERLNKQIKAEVKAEINPPRE